MVTKPHPNAEVLRALADGKQIQFKVTDFGGFAWVNWTPDSDVSPLELSPSYRLWRVAPTPDSVFYACISTERTKYSHSPRIRSIWEGPFPVSCTDNANVIFTVDGETGKLKAVKLIK